MAISSPTPIGFCYTPNMAPSSERFERGFAPSRCRRRCDPRVCVAVLSRLVLGCSSEPILDASPSTSTVAPLADAAMPTCIDAMQRHGDADFGSTRAVVAYQVDEAGVEVTVCAHDEGSMKIADALIVKVNGPPLELWADVANHALLPRVNKLVSIDGRRVLALGWFRSPPLGVEALLFEIGGPDLSPALADRLVVEGLSPGFVVEEPLRRIGVVGLEAGSASLEVEAPPTRSFWLCEGKAEPWQPALWFNTPGQACKSKPGRLTWVEIGAAGFVR
jgi:hypothetical protein